MNSVIQKKAAKLTRRLAPGTARQLRTFIERRALRGVPTQTCSSDRLCQLSREGVLSILRAGCYTADWVRLASTLKDGFPDGSGGVNWGDRRALYQFIRGRVVRSVLEVGTHIGASTAAIAAALRDHSRTTAGQFRLVSVDVSDVNDQKEKPWLNHGAVRSPQQTVQLLDCDSLVSFVTADSTHFMERATEDESPHVPAAGFDLIFLDGDHRASTLYREVPLALRLLRNGGVVMLHDYYPRLAALWQKDTVIPGPYLAVGRLIAEGAAIEAVPFVELPWDTKLGSCLTSLAILSRAKSRTE